MKPLISGQQRLSASCLSRLIWRMGSGLLMLACLTSAQSAEVCYGLDDKTINAVVDQDTTCTLANSISNRITVKGDASVVNGVTLSLLAPGITFIGPVSIENGGILHVIALKSILNDTGITACADGATIGLACPVTDYPGQDAQYGRDVTHNDDTDGHAGFSYTKLDVDGTPLSANANVWSCVKDNVTGMVWEVKTDDGGIHDKDNTYRWGGKTALGSGYGNYFADWDSLVEGSNAESLCGFSDWRVPTITELVKLLSSDRAGPATDTDYFPFVAAVSDYWTASPAAISSGSAWYVRFFHGTLSTLNKGSQEYVRLVRNGQ